MIFYQQGAVVDARIKPGGLRHARRDTLAGAILTQGIMITVIVTLAATVGRTNPNAGLASVGQIATAVAPFLGLTQAKILVGAAILGGALVSALVVSVAGSWGVAEVFGWKHSLNSRPGRDSAKFYITYATAHIAGAILVLFSVDLVGLAIDVEVLNALMLPLVLGFLLALEAKTLSGRDKNAGARALVTYGTCAVVMLLGVCVIIPTLGL
jgi:Mn2+/Fe2+ NRAMP family transporter